MAGTVLINSEGVAEQLAPEHVQGALQSGYHVPLIDQEGNPVSASFDEARNLVSQGSHAQPSVQQLQGLLEDAHYGSGGQQALAFVEGALNPATLGLYGKVAENTGLTTRQEMLKRAEHNPGTAALGELAGTVGSLALLPEASIPGLIGKAGQAVQKGIAAEGLIGKAAQIGLQGAIEGALYGAQHEATEAVLGDPNTTAENMLSHIGLSAALGGGLNLALAPVFKAAEVGANIAGKKLAPIVEGLAKQKKNAPEIIAANERMGTSVMPEQILESDTAEHLASSIYKAGEAGRSFPAIEKQQELAQNYSIIRQKLDDVLGADIGMTKAQVGEQLKQGFVDSLSAETKPISELYNTVKQMGQDVPLFADDIKKVSKDVMSIDGLLSSSGKPLSESSPSYQLAKRVSEELGQLNTVDDLRRYGEQIGRDSIAKPELKYVAGQIKNKITDLTENSIAKFAEESGMPGALDLIAQHKLAKSQYAGLREKITDLGSVIGKKLRRGEGPQAFIDWLESTPPEQVANRLFTKNNSKFLSFLQENYPEQATLLANLKKSQFRTAPGALVDGELKPGKLLKEIDKLEPEIKEFLFSKDHLQTIEDAQTILESIPKDANPSGTAAMMMSLGDVLNSDLRGVTLTGLGLTAAKKALTHGSDFLKVKTLERLAAADPHNAPLIMALGRMSNMIMKTNQQIQKGSGAIFASPIARGSENNDQSYEPEVKLNKIGTMVLNHATNPEGLIDHLSQATEGISQYAPNSTDAFSAAVGRGVQFLSTKVPTPQKNAPLDPELPPSKADITKFNRYAQIVDKPVSILQHVKNGTVLPQDIETLTAVYPTLYQNMQQAVMDKMITHATKTPVWEIPYKTRIGLSQFLGQNLDSSLSSQSIQSSQLALASAAQEQAQKQMQQTRPSKVGMGKYDVQKDMTKSQQTASRSAS